MADAASVARRWLEARGRRDLEEIAALTASDAIWESPVVGAVEGRDAVVAQVEAGFDDTDAFDTELLSLECRESKAVAVIRNRGRRHGRDLDSLQALCLHVDRGEVARIRIAVDDPSAVEAFWSD